MKHSDMPAMPVMDESERYGQHYGLTKREYFTATLPHLEVELASVEVLGSFIGREINQDDVVDLLLATAEFEAKFRAMRADAHLAELEKTHEK